MRKLKARWGIDSNIQLLIILVVFSITGSSSVYLGQPLLDYFGVQPLNFNGSWWSTWLYWFLRLLVIFPLYQVLLLAFGWLFGQFSFFWKMEKKILKRMGLGFIFNRNPA